MNKNVQIVNTVTGMSNSLDVIASNVIAGEYTADELKSKMSSIANVLETTASAHKHILSQVSDVESFSTVASTTAYDDTLSKVLATQAQATLVGQMIKGELKALGADDEVQGEDEEEVTDEVQEAVSFDEEDKDSDSKKDVKEAHGALTGDEDMSKLDHSDKKEVPAKTEEVPAKIEDKEMKSESAQVGKGTNHSEINPQVKQVEKSGANEVIQTGSDTNAPTVKTTASATAMSSEASAQPTVSWNFN